MQNKLYYGAEYYAEYIPCDRVEEDIRLMREAGMNCIRLGESTWSSMEPREGSFAFDTILRVIKSCETAKISVIVATPTYAVPAWMVNRYPEIIAENGEGKRPFYGKRQLMDITNPNYLYYAERIIRKLVSLTAPSPAVIGFQLDNETEYYDNAGEQLQKSFVEYLREKYDGSLEKLNEAFGLSYWSNRIDSWEGFPDIRGTVNAGLAAEFDAFRRAEVTKFLAWQAKIVREYLRPDQFITHNLNLYWNADTYGLNPNVDDNQVGRVLDICGIDIYHPAQDDLTGMEIAFGGDLARSVKRRNYLVLETQAQGFPGWLPYPGQLRLQAYSHFASGADMVEYWPWCSIHNGPETFWKGVLGHDLKVGDTYREVQQIGKELRALSDRLLHLKKHNRAAILISNRALQGLSYFPLNISSGENRDVGYNDVLKKIFRQLYNLNIECDFLWPDSDCLEDYDLLVLPALYAADEGLCQRISEYVKNGGNLFATFKTSYANEQLKVYHDGFPHGLEKCLGMTYSDFTLSRGERLCGKDALPSLSGRKVTGFMELLIPDTASVLAGYKDGNWGGYAAITEHCYGAGKAWYLGCLCEDEAIRDLLRYVLIDCGLYRENQEEFPLILRKGTNGEGRELCYYLNFSGEERQTKPLIRNGTELFSMRKVRLGERLRLPPWGVIILEE